VIYALFFFVGGIYGAGAVRMFSVVARERFGIGRLAEVAIALLWPVCLLLSFAVVTATAVFGYGESGAKK
jgi:hypothetical protein